MIGVASFIYIAAHLALFFADQSYDFAKFFTEITKRIYLITSALGGALAGLAACLLVLQYDVHPFVGLSFGPITFLICVLGGLGNLGGGLVAAFVFAQFISVGGFFFHIEWGYVIAFVFFIAVMFWRPQGIFGGK